MQEQERRAEEREQLQRLAAQRAQIARLNAQCASLQGRVSDLEQLRREAAGLEAEEEEAREGRWQVLPRRRCVLARRSQQQKQTAEACSRSICRGATACSLACTRA